MTQVQQFGGGASLALQGTNQGAQATEPRAASSSTSTEARTTDQALVAAATGLKLMGFSVREQTDAAEASFNLRNGDDDADPLVFVVNLLQNESRSEWFGPDGLDCADGIFLEVLSGTIDLVVHHKTVA